MFKLKKLLSNVPEVTVRGSKEIEITGISANSKTIAPGNIFVAKKGLSDDGSQYINEAISSGAIAIVTDLYDPFLPSHITQIIAPKVIEVEAKLAASYYHFPSKHLFLTGVTGTNGKTTTTFLIRHLLSTMHHPCGMIGTIEWVLGRKIQPAVQTTPDVITTHRLLREMLNGGCLACTMEVSSHGLHQGRVEGLDYDVAVFTNLTRDHLDYHKSMEEYGAAKARLFASLHPSSVALFNVDSEAWTMMSQNCKARKMTYAIDHPADLRAEDIHLSDKGTQFTLVYQSVKTPITTPLIGKFNVYNVLAAMGAALAGGLQLDAIKERLTSFPQVPGRLQRIENPKGLSIFVDYAHTGDALENVLRTLRELIQGRLVVLFGCGGDRDHGRRQEMGKVARQLADYSIITSDNPRSEDPQSIISDILSVYTDPKQTLVEPDRKTAIEKGIALIQPGDILLIAGKGHERYQIIGAIQHPFDDCEVARKAAKNSHF